MAFGDASAPTFPSAPPKATANVDNTSSAKQPRRTVRFKDDTTPPPDLGLLDHGWISEHLTTLNESTEPVLDGESLQALLEDVVEQLGEIVGLPVTEVYEQSTLR